MLRHLQGPPPVDLPDYITLDIVPSMRPVAWIGSSKRDLLAMPREVQQLAGRELRRVQRGADPLDWKPMRTVGLGAREIRTHVKGEHRIFYVATFAEAVYVLRVFQKKSQKTSARDLALGRERYRAMLRERRST